jgi:hypothetical protein
VSDQPVPLAPVLAVGRQWTPELTVEHGHHFVAALSPALQLLNLIPGIVQPSTGYQP